MGRAWVLRSPLAAAADTEDQAGLASLSPWARPCRHGGLGLSLELTGLLASPPVWPCGTQSLPPRGLRIPLTVQPGVDRAVGRPLSLQLSLLVCQCGQLPCPGFTRGASQLFIHSTNTSATASSKMGAGDRGGHLCMVREEGGAACLQEGSPGVLHAECRERADSHVCCWSPVPGCPH